MSNSRNRSQTRAAAARRAPASTPRPRAEARRPTPRPPETSAARTAVAPEDEAPPAPWHFKVLLVGTVGYLLYRFVWFIFWLTGHGWHG